MTKSPPPAAPVEPLAESSAEGTSHPPLEPFASTSGSGWTDLPSDNGLPVPPNIVWERKSDGSVEAWHTLRPKAPRRERTYLKRVGKRQLAEWQALPVAERFAFIVSWLADRLAEKGIA